MSRIKDENLIELVGKGVPILDAMELQRIARGLHGIAERYAMGAYGSDESVKRATRRAERLIDRARAIAEARGLKLYYQADPRGWPLAVYSPTDPGYNNPEADGGIYGTRVCPFR